MKKTSGKKVSKDSPLAPFDSPIEPIPLAFPALPVLVALPSRKDSLPSPAFFAEQVKKLYPLKFMETKEVERGEDPDYTADPQGVVMRRVARAVEAQLRYAREFGSSDEVARLRDVAKRARHKTRISYYDRGEEYELYLWFWSFHLCGRWLEAGDKDEKGSSKEGDKAALINLPHAFPFNPSFFLGQWWVRFLVHSMWEQGEKKNINLMLFGKPGEGKPTTPAAALEMLRRNHPIYKRIKELTAQGVTLYKASHLVASEVGLSWTHVKNIYLKWTA